MPALSLNHCRDPIVGVAVGPFERLMFENGEPETWNPRPPIVSSAALARLARAAVATPATRTSSAASVAKRNLFTGASLLRGLVVPANWSRGIGPACRSEEHTSELQSRLH